MRPILVQTASRNSKKTGIKRKRDPEATKKKLLNAAQKAFTEKGFDAARVDEIAGFAGVNKRMIYQYFGNKNDLYERVLQVNFQRAFETSLESLSEESNCPYKQLTSAIRGYFNMLAENPDVVRLFVWASLNYGRWPSLFEDMFESGLQEVVETVERGIAEGVFRKDIDPRLLVFTITGLCLQYFSRRPMIQSLWGASADSKKVQSIALNGMLDLISRGILTDPTT